MTLTNEVVTARRLPPPAERRAIRERAGISRPRIAAELGVTPATVANWESGAHDPRGSEVVARYVAVLDELRQATS